MAIDLFCYVTETSDAVRKTLDAIQETHQGLFFERFLISEVHAVTPVEEDIALDFGLIARCLFLVRLNEKEAADLISTVTYILKVEFGASKLIVLHEGETLI